MEILKEERVNKMDFIQSKMASLPDGRIVVGFGERDAFCFNLFKLNEKKELVYEKEFIEHTKYLSFLYILEDGKIATTQLDGTSVFDIQFEMKSVCKIEEEKKKNFTSLTQLEVLL